MLICSTDVERHMSIISSLNEIVTLLIIVTFKPMRCCSPGPTATTNPPGRRTLWNSSTGHGEKIVSTQSKLPSLKGNSKAFATANETSVWRRDARRTARGAMSIPKQLDSMPREASS